MKKYDYFLFVLTEDSVDESVFEDLFENDDLSIEPSVHKQGILWTLVYTGDKKDDVYASVFPLVRALTADRLKKIRSQIISINLNAVVYHDTYTSSFFFPKDVVRLINEVDFDLDMEVTCYPTDFEETYKEQIERGLVWVGTSESQVERGKPIEKKKREDVIAVLGELIDDYIVNDDSWENPRLGNYLEAMHAWLVDWGNKYDPEPSWEFIIRMLKAAKIYE